MATRSDPLTGLPGRADLDQTLKDALATTDTAALAVLDIDYFMDINTGLGHEAGDRLLQNLATMLEEAAPGSTYRVSGDEFAIVLPGLSLEQAFLRMEALRAKVETSPDRLGLPERRTITVTLGVAQYPRDARDPRGLVSAADAALASAKENGRNQVGLPPNEEMVMKSCYYPASSVRKLKVLAERLNRKESRLLREALDDLFRKYDTPREA